MRTTSTRKFSSSLYKKQVALALLFLVGALSIPSHTVHALLPFGGKIVFMEPCFYCPSLSCAALHLTVLLPAPGWGLQDIVYIPGLSILYSYYAPIPVNNTLGDGYPGVCFSASKVNGSWVFKRMKGIDMWVFQQGTSLAPSI